MITPIEQALDLIQFNDQGLVPAIAQEEATGAVFMMAWMNRDAVRATLETSKVTYRSRARQELWGIGATSGHGQELLDLRIDCDTLLLLVRQTGAACHTGKRTCFFKAIRAAGVATCGNHNQGPN